MSKDKKNIKYSRNNLYLKTISLVVSILFLLNSITIDNALGLNVWLGNQLVIKRQAMMLKLLESRLIYDDSLKEVSDVELVSSGKYRVASSCKADREELLRTLINKDFSVLMDLMQKDDEFKFSYRNIIDLLKDETEVIKKFSEVYPEQALKYKFSKELLIKAIVAKVFEINFLLKHNLIVDWNDLDPEKEAEELAFYKRVFPIVECNRHLFPIEFWKQGDRYRAINTNAKMLVEVDEAKGTKRGQTGIQEKGVMTPENVEASLEEAMNKVNYNGDIRALENTLSSLAEWAREDYDSVFEGIRNFSRKYPILTDDKFHVAIFNLEFHDRAVIETMFRHIFISAAKKDKIKVCILAAGSGIRTWPMSNGTQPKQLRSDFLGDMSPLQATVQRLTNDNFLSPNQIFITTNKKIETSVKEQVSSFGVPKKNIIVEPRVAGTAMAVGYVAKYFEEMDPESTMIIMVADSYVGKNSIEQFRDNIIEAASIVQAGPYFSSIGVKPAPGSAETQYGYIKINDETVIKGVYRVNRFYEKPDKNKAEEYSRRNNKFLWEAGIIAADVKTVIKAFKVVSPEYYSVMEKLGNYFSGKGTSKDLTGPYEQIIKRKDKGLPIHINPVLTEYITKGTVPEIGYAAVRADISWTDIGDLRRFPRYLYAGNKDVNDNIIMEKTSRGIVPTGKDMSGRILDVKNCNIILSPGRNVIVKGISDGLIIDSDDSITTLLSNAELSLFSNVNEQKGFLDIDKWEDLGRKGSVQAKVVSGRSSVAYSRSGLSMMNGMDDSVLIRMRDSFEIYGGDYRSEGVKKVDRLIREDLNDKFKCLHIAFDERDNAAIWNSGNETYKVTLLFRGKDDFSAFIGFKKDGSFVSFAEDQKGKRSLNRADIVRVIEFMNKSSLGLDGSFAKIESILNAFTDKYGQLLFGYKDIKMPFEASFLYSEKKEIASEQKVSDIDELKTYLSQIKFPGNDPIEKAILWMISSGGQNLSDDPARKGAFHGYFDSKEGRYPFVYSEITGYAMSFLSYLYLKTGEKDFLNRAELAADWVLTQATHKKTGGVKTRLYYDPKEEATREFSFENEIIHMFDTGIVINGLISLYKITGNRDYIKGAERMGDFILGLDNMPGEFFPFALDGKTEKPMGSEGKWSRTGGAFQVKALNGLVDLYQLTNDTRYSELAIKICRSAMRKQEKDGRFVTEDHSETTIHPHCYAAEGLLYIGRELGKPEFVEAARKATKWLFDNQMENGGIPLLFTKDLKKLKSLENGGKPVRYSKDGGFLALERADGLAQALRLGLYFYEKGDFRTQEFKEKLKKLKERLEAFQIKEGIQAGGFEFGYEFSGERCDPEAGNIWVTMFAVQALSKFNRIFHKNKYFRDYRKITIDKDDEGKDIVLDNKIKAILKKKPETKICITLGTRPEIIKLWPVIDFCKKYKVPFFVVNTNQNFTSELSNDIFESIGLDKGDFINLLNPFETNIFDRQTFLESYTERIEQVLDEHKPSVVIVQGDTNTACAAAMAAYVSSVPLAHVEAGMRSFDLSMPEERNRITIGKLADYHFAPTDHQINNLDDETNYFINPDSRFFVTGNTVVDAFDMISEKVVRQGGWTDVLENVSTGREVVRPGKYFLLTMHRPANVDDNGKLLKMLSFLDELSGKWGYPIVFPVHPRTRSRLGEGVIKDFKNINFVKPVDYEEMYVLEKNARMILTDSGGLQEEAAVLGIPCVVLRDSTERIESVYEGMAILVDSDLNEMERAVDFFMKTEVRPKRIYGDGRASTYIMKALLGQAEMSTIRKKAPIGFKGYERSQMEKLRLVYRQFGFLSFNLFQLLSNGISVKQEDLDILEELNVISKVDGFSDIYRINIAFKGRDKRETEEALSCIYNMRINRKGKTVPLWEIDLLEEKDIVGAELRGNIKIELAMYHLKQMMSDSYSVEELSVDMSCDIKVERIKGRNIAFLPCREKGKEKTAKAVVVDLDWLRESVFSGSENFTGKRSNLWKTKYPESIYLKDKKDLLELNIWPVVDLDNYDRSVAEWVAGSGVYREVPDAVRNADKVSLSDISLEFIPTDAKNISLKMFPRLSEILTSTFRYFVKLSKATLSKNALCRGGGDKIADEDTFEIVIWRGYASGFTSGMFSSIEKASRGTAFTVRFEKDLQDIFDEVNNSSNYKRIYLFPYSEGTGKVNYDANVIFVNSKEDHENNSYDPWHILNLIALGVSYHDDNNMSFRAIQNLLGFSNGKNNVLTIELLKAERYEDFKYYTVFPGEITDIDRRKEMVETVVEKLNVMFEGLKTGADSHEEDQDIKKMSDKKEKDPPGTGTERYLSGMHEDEILSLISPGHVELKKHSEAVWKYAENFAATLGVKKNTEAWNLLRVVCYAHDIGGCLGFEGEEDKENHLKRLAKRANIDYLGKSDDYDGGYDEVLNKVVARMRKILGEDEFPLYKDYIKILDHQRNTIRRLKEQNVEISKDTKKMILNHQDLPGTIPLLKMTYWSSEELDIYISFILADIIEQGNNYYKRAHRKKPFESVEDTIIYFLKEFNAALSVQKESSGSEENRQKIEILEKKLKDRLNVLFKSMRSGDLDEDIRKFSRSPIETTRFAQESSIVAPVNRAWDKMPFSFFNKFDAGLIAGAKKVSFKDKFAEFLKGINGWGSKELRLDGSVLVFSEQLAFNHGIAILLPRLAEENIEIGIITKNSKQEDLVAELNSRIRSGSKIKCLKTINSVKEVFPEMRRCYYYFVKEDLNGDNLIRGVIPIDITDTVDKIVRMLGHTFRLNTNDIDRLFEAMKEFRTYA